MNIQHDGGIMTIEEIERLIQPYDMNHLEKLRQDLLNNPDRRIVHVWDGYHLNDREVYEICKQLDVKVNYVEMDFSNINDAGIYVCENQIKRHDISVEYKKYLIGEWFSFERALNSDVKGNGSKYSVAGLIASKAFISVGTVLKYHVYSSAVDEVFDQDTQFARRLLSGDVKISHENMIELSRLKPEEIRTVARSVEEERVDHITLSYIRNEVKWSHVQPKNQMSRRERSEEKARRRASIRQMPEYDPDSEVNSLCMTIDSWISSIQRVNDSGKIPQITNLASLRLMRKLSVLEHTVNMIQESLVERTGK